MNKAVCYIYAIRGLVSGSVKIGISRNVRQRMIVLKSSTAEPLELLVAVPGTRTDEKVAHIYCDAERISGEWFRPGKSVERLIRFMTERGRVTRSAWRLT